MMTVFLPLNESLFSDPALVCPLRLALDLLNSVHGTIFYDTFGDHSQVCQTKSVDSQVHDWVVYKMGTILGSVGHRVKIHKKNNPGLPGNC